MTKYVLPEVLGGGQVEAEEEWGGRRRGGRPSYQLAGSRITLVMPEGKPLECVLPSEPSVGSVVILGRSLDDLQSGVVFRRYEDGWAHPGSSLSYFVSWEALVKSGTIEYLEPWRDVP